MRRDLLRLVADLARGDRAGGAGRRSRSAGIRAEAVRRRVGVAFLDFDVRGRDAELLGDDLRVGRLVPLALRLGAEARRGLAGGVHADLARVEHLDPENVEMLRGPGADDFGEARDADAHQLAPLPLLGLLLPEIGIPDLLHRLLQGRRIIAAVVLPAERRTVRELLRRDEVLEPQVGRVHLELLRQHVDHALDRVGRFGDAERAAIGDAAGRLVGVHAVDFGERVLEVVGAGADGEQARRKLRWVGRGVRVPVIGQRLDPEAGHRPVLLRRELGRHVIVAGERVGLQVLHPVLDPLDRLADDHRRGDGNHVARIDRNLAAESAADVGRDDADLLLRQPDMPGDERQRRFEWHAAPASSCRR